MSFEFSADEIFEMAEQMEKNGQQFYNDAAEAAQREDHKKLLRELAGMEVDHEKTFKAMRAELTQRETETNVFDPEGDAALYLKALVDTRVFFKKEMDVSSMEKILKAAIEAEKDSIVFYLGMKNAVPEELGRGRLEDIIKEEMSHVRLLSRELIQISR